MLYPLSYEGAAAGSGGRSTASQSGSKTPFHSDVIVPTARCWVRKPFAPARGLAQQESDGSGS